MPLFLLTACGEKKEASSAPDAEKNALPGRSVARSGGEEDAPDPRVALRAGPALAAWVEAREEGPVRTEAVLAVADALRATPPEARPARLGTFKEPTIRKQLESILSQPPP